MPALKRTERVARAFALAQSGRIAELRRDLRSAHGLYQEARDVLEGVGPTPLLANILRWQGSVRRDEGKLEEADELYRQSLDVAVACGSLAARAAAINCRGVLAQRSGDLARAERTLEEAQRMAMEAGEIRLTGMIRQNLGVLFNVRGDLERALEHHRAAVEAFENMGDDEAVSWALNNLGMVFNDLNETVRAERAFLRGLAIARNRRDRPLQGILLCNYAEGLIATERWEEATAALETAFAIACEGQDLKRGGEALKFLGVLERECRRHTAALERFDQALSTATSVQDALLTAEVLRERGELHLRSDDATAAHEDWAAAERAFRSAGATRDADAVRERMAGLSRPRQKSAQSLGEPRGVS